MGQNGTLGDSETGVPAFRVRGAEFRVGSRDETRSDLEWQAFTHESQVLNEFENRLRGQNASAALWMVLAMEYEYPKKD
jgi:hypothetical protein